MASKDFNYYVFKTFWRLKLLTTFFLCCFLPTTLSVPTRNLDHSGSSCVSYCKDSKLFLYQPGKTYIYNYGTEINTSLNQGSRQQSRFHISTVAHITAITPCEFNVQFTSTTLEDSEPQDSSIRKAVEEADELTSQLEEHSIRFAFQDGEIEQICSHPNDPVWVLNVKRGMISLFQNIAHKSSSSKHLIEETDINGICPTSYEIIDQSAWRNGKSYSKTKDLESCRQRFTHISTIQSVPYSSNSIHQDAPLLKGSSHCSQSVYEGLIERVDCTEERLFKPFESDESGGKTVTTQVLTFVQESQDKEEQEEEETRWKTKSLIFEAELNPENMETSVSKVVHILGQLQGEEDRPLKIRENAPLLFIQLVDNLRTLDENSLRSLFEDSGSFTPLGKNMLLDALPLVNSAPSMVLMQQLISKNLVSEEQIDAWLNSVAFIKHPTQDMIVALAPLIADSHRKSVILGITSLIHSYCNENDCSRSEIVTAILDHLLGHLGSGCNAAKTDPEKAKLMILALKGIGNAGRLNSKNILLNPCMMDEVVPVEVRLATLDAFRRVPCQDLPVSSILTVYGNTRADTEVRIKAYLTAMRCVNRGMIDIIKEKLYSEEVNQVSSFIWTHLTNLQETTSSDKQTIRDLLANDYLKNKFRTDARKFSRNFEGTMYWEDINAGGNVDGNIIFTPESFLPKSAMVNMTAHLFGESVNLLEIGARVQSIEHLIEPIFGPNGYFPDERIAEFFHHSGQRSKRSVRSNDIHRLTHILEQSGPDLEEIPGGSLYARVFGNEINFKNFEIHRDSAIPDVVDENGRNWLDISAVLSNLSTGKKAQFTKSNVILDVTYTVGTSAGLPLSLGIQAASSISMSATGKVNVGKLIDKKELEIHGSLKPSVSIKLNGLMTTRLGGLHSNVVSGLRLENTLWSSTSVEAHLEMKGIKIIKASVSIPDEIQEILKVSSQVVMLRASGEPPKVEEGLPGAPKIDYQHCIDDMISWTGLRMCVETTVPKHLSFPLETPAVGTIYIEKLDDFKGYLLDFRYDATPSTMTVDALFDAPGSNVNRKYALKFDLDKTMGHMNMNLDTPSNNLIAKGQYSQFFKNFEFQMISDEDQILLLNTSLRHVGEKIHPKFLLQFFDRPFAEFGGVLDMSEKNHDKKKVSMDLTLKHLTQKPIRIKGDLTRSDELQEASIRLESYILTGNLRSQIRNRMGHWSTTSSFRYSWKNGKPETVDVSAKIQESQKGTLSKIRSSAMLITSQFPDHNTEFSWDYLKSSGYCENIAKFSIGKSTWDGHTLYNRHSGLKKDGIHIKLSLLVPRHELDYNIEFLHQNTRKGLTTKFNARTDPMNEIAANLNYAKQFGYGALMRRSLTAEATWPGSRYLVHSKLVETTEGHFEGEVIFNLNDRKEMKGTLVYDNRSSNYKMNHVVEFRGRGFTPSPFSGSMEFTAGQSEAHATGQFGFESEDSMSNRWSASVDYTHHNLKHKVDAKLFTSNRRYSCEMSYGTTNEGDKQLLMDLHLEKRTVIEAGIQGSYPNMMVLFSLTPDKTEFPDSSLIFNGEIANNEKLNIQLEYFGDKYGVYGAMSENNIRTELTWPQDGKFMVDLTAVEFSMEKIEFNLDAVTPFGGFRTMSLHINHLVQDNSMRTQLAGNLEKRNIKLFLEGLIQPLAFEFKSSWEITGNLPYILEMTIRRKIERKTFSIVYGESNDETVLHFDLELEPNETNLVFKAKGWQRNLPQIYITFNRLLGRQMDTKLIAEWKMAGEHTKQLKFLSTHAPTPLSCDFSISTPWAQLQFFEGKVTSQPDNTRHISFKSKSNAEVLPTNVFIIMKGDIADFSTHSTISYKGDNVLILLDGGFNGLLNSTLDAVLTTSENKYKLSGKSVYAPGISYIGEITSLSNGEEASVGTQWSYMHITKFLKAAIWAKIPSEPRMLAAVHHEIRDGASVSSFKVTRGIQPYIVVQNEVKGENKRSLTVESTVTSSIYFIPSVNLNLGYEVKDGENFNAALKFRPLDAESNIMGLKAIWISKLRNLDLQVGFSGGKVITGSGKFGQHEVQVDGQLEHTESKFAITMDIKCNRFDPIEVKCELNRDPSNFVAMLAISSKSSNVITFKVTKFVDSYGSISGYALLDSMISSKYETIVELDKRKDVYTTVAAMDDLTVIKIQLSKSKQMSLTDGNVQLAVSSSLYPQTLTINWSALYKLAENELTVSSKYEDSFQTYTLTSNGAWKDEKKHFVLNIDGDLVASFSAELLGMSTLESSLTYNNNYLGGIILQYQPNFESSYTFGEHSLALTILGEHRKNPKEFTLVLAIDPIKAKLLLDTPFKGWSHSELHGSIEFTTYARQIVIQLVKEEEKFDTSMTYAVSSPQNEATRIEFTAMTHGFEAWQRKLAETFGLNLNIQRDAEAQINIGWSPKSITYKQNLPLKNLKELQLSTSWELRQPRKHLQGIIILHDKVYESKMWVETRSNMKKGKGQISLSLDPSTNKMYTLEFAYNVEKDFDVNLSFETPINRYATQLELQMSPLTAHIKVETPFKNYEESEGKIEYLKHDKGYQAVVFWRLNEKKKKFSLTLENNPGYLTMNLETPIPNWNTVDVTVAYDLEFKEPLIITAVRQDGKTVKLDISYTSASTGTEKSGGESDILVAVVKVHLETPFDSMNSTFVTANYNRVDSLHKGSIDILSNGKRSWGSFNFQVTEVDTNVTEMATNMAIESDHFHLDATNFKVIAMLDPKGKNMATVLMESNGNTQQIEGTIDLTPSHRKFLLTTPLKILEKIQFSLEHRNDQVTILYGRHEGFGKISEFSGELTLLNGLSESMIKMSIQTPVPEFNSVIVEASNNYHPGNIQTQFFLQTDTVRWILSCNGTYTATNGKLTLLINTPFKSYNNVLSTLSYNFEHNKDINLSVTKNSQVWINFNGFTQPNKLALTFKSENGPLTYLDGSIDWSDQKTFQFTAVGTDSNIQAIFNGPGSGFFNINAQLWKPFDLLLEWSAEGSLTNGDLNGKIYNTNIGLHSLKSKWTISNGWKQGDLDFWIHSDSWKTDKGLTFQFISTPNSLGFGNFKSDCTYLFGETKQKAYLEVAILKNNEGMYTLDGSCQTPFWNEFNINGMLTLGPNYNCKILSKFNGAILGSLDATATLTSMKSETSIQLKIPRVIDPVEITSLHDYTQGNEKVINFSVSYGNHSVNVESQMHSVKDKTELRLGLEVNTIYDAMPVVFNSNIGAVSSKSRDSTRSVEIFLESNRLGKWSLNGSLRPNMENLFSRLKLVSAIPEVLPSTMIEAHWNGRFSDEIDSKLLIQVGRSELLGVLAIGNKKLEASLNSTFPQLPSTTIIGLLHDDNHLNGKSVQLKFSRDDTKYLLDGKLSHEYQPEFVITISDVTSDKGKEPVVLGSVKGSLVGDGNVEVSGSWAGNNIVLIGNIQSRGDHSWWKAGDAKLRVLANSEEKLLIQTSHIFMSGEYSFNATTGETYIFKSYLLSSSETIALTALAQWEQNKPFGLSLNLEKGKFQVSSPNPYLPFSVGTTYRLTPDEFHVQGNVSFGEEKSGLTISGKRTDNKWDGVLKCDISILENPIIIHTTVIEDPTTTTNIKASLNLSIGTTSMDIAGSFLAPPPTMVDDRLETSYTVQYTLNLPFKQFSHISGSYYLTKPLEAYDYMNLVTVTTIKGEPTKLILGYQLPYEDDREFLIKTTLDTPQLENVFHVLINTGRNYESTFVKGVLNCAGHSFQVNSDYNFPNFNIDYKADIKHSLFEIRKHSLSLSTVTDWVSMLSLKLNAECNNRILNMGSEVSLGDKVFITKVFLEAPFMFNAPHKYELRLEKDSKALGTYSFEINGVGFTDAISSNGKLHLESESTVKGFAKLTGALGSHYVDFSVDSSMPDIYHAALNMESTAFTEGKQLTVDATVKTFHSGFDSIVRLRKKNSINKLTLKVWQDEFTSKVYTETKLSAPDFFSDPIMADSEWQINAEKLAAKLNTTIFGETHSLEGFLHHENFELFVAVESQLIPFNKFDAHVRYILKDGKVDLLAMTKYGESIWKIDNAFWFHGLRNCRAHVEFMTPYEAWERIVVAGKSTKDEVYAETYFPVKGVPNFKIKLSGMESVHDLQWKLLEPKLEINLPWMSINTYAHLKPMTRAQGGKLELFFEKTNASRISTKYQLSTTVALPDVTMLSEEKPFAAMFFIESPIPALRNVHWDVSGKFTWNKLLDVKSNGNWNEEKGKFTLFLNNKDGSIQLLSELLTPFSHHEHYKVSFGVEDFRRIGIGKAAHAEVFKSTWTEPLKLGVEYRYRYNGFLDIEGEVDMTTSSEKIPLLHAEFKSLAIDDSKKYYGVMNARVGSYEPKLEIKGDLHEDQVTFNILVRTNKNENQLVCRLELMRPDDHDRFHVMLKSTFRNDEILLLKLTHTYQMAHCVFKMATPWGKLEIAGNVMPLSSIMQNELSVAHLLENTNVSFGIQFASKKIIQLELVSREGKRVLEIYNPIQPVSLTMDLERKSGEKLKLKLEFCWNLKNPKKSTLGVEILSAKKGVGVEYGLYAQAAKYGFFKIRVNNLITSSKLDHAVQISWDLTQQDIDGKFCYSVKMEKILKPNKNVLTLDTKVDFPSRSIVLSSYAGEYGNKFVKNAKLWWDYETDKTKVLEFNLDRVQTMQWGGHNWVTNMTFNHPALTHPVVIKCDQAFKFDRLERLRLNFGLGRIQADDLEIIFQKPNEKWNKFILNLSHKATKTDFTIDYIGVDDQMILFSFMNQQGDMKKLKLMLQEDASTNTFTIQTFNEETFQNLLETRLTTTEHETDLKIKFLELEIQTVIQSNTPLLKMLVQVDETRKWQMIAGLPHESEITFKLWRELSGMNVHDFTASLRLNDSKAISARIHWRPELMGELTSVNFKTDVFNVMPFSEYTIPEILNDITNEFEERARWLQPAISQMFSGLWEFSKAEINTLSNELRRFVSTLEWMYERNAFYLQSACDLVFSVNGALKEIRIKLVDMTTAVVQATYNGLRWIISNVYEGLRDCQWKFEETVMRYWDRLENYLDELWNQGLESFSLALDVVSHILQIVSDGVEGRLEELEKKLMNVTFIQKIVKLYKDYANWLEELSIQDIIEKIEETFNIKIWKTIEDTLEPFIETIQDAMKDESIEKLLNTPPFPYIRFMMRKGKTIVSKIWDFIEVEKQVKELVRLALRHLDEIVHRNLPANSFVWDLHKGHIEYNQVFNMIEWDSFTQYPRWRASPDDINDISQIGNFYYKIMEKIEELKPMFELTWKEILPPFSATAVMTGDHHYTTYDGKYFHFAGECSYLLAADTSSKNFSLIVNYEKNGASVQKKSYTIITNDKTLVIDLSDFKVMLDGRKKELPVLLGTTLVTRDSVNTLKVTDSRGFLLSCTLQPRLCTFSMSGWYFGKMVGLLGSYDYEKVNDWKSPDGQIMEDVSTFAYSWRVGDNSDQCSMENFAPALQETKDLQNICHEMLVHKYSPLRPCFNKVPREMYMDMCLYDVSLHANSAAHTSAACSVFGAYVSECQRNGVDVWLPSPCVICKTEDGRGVTTGENVTLDMNGVSKPPMSADVVILLEKAPCLKGTQFTRMVKALDHAMKSNGIRGNRYAIIGFGGEGSFKQPHIVTIAGQVWTHNTLFKLPVYMGMDGDNQGDLYAAIKMAISLPFRAGVSKNLIAFTCGDEDCGETKAYADMLTMLVENDIELHMVTAEGFSTKTTKKTPDLRNVLGIDKDGVYSARNSREADKSLQRYISQPKDLCTPLALETNGTRFHLGNYSKKFLQVWSQRMVQDATPSSCQRCECSPDKTGFARFQCHHCISPSIRQFMEEWKQYEAENQEEFAKLTEGDIEFDMNDYITFE